MEQGNILLVLVKIVDDLLIGGSRKIVRDFIKRLEKVYQLGTIVHLPGSFRFFGLKVEQDEDGTIMINGDEKLQSIEPCDLSRLRRKNINADLNPFELFSFQSVNGSLGFLGMTVSPFAAFGASHLQQTITWASHLSKRPVKSIGFAEVLACGDAIDEGKLIAQTYWLLLGHDVHLYVAVDSKDLWSSLSTCRNPEDKSILADVQLLRYNFETHHLNKLIWLPRKINLADPLTKRDSPLCETLQLMLFDGTIPIDFATAETRASNKSLR